MRDAYNQVKVQLWGVIGVIVITYIAFATVAPEKLVVERELNTITGNAAGGCGRYSHLYRLLSTYTMSFSVALFERNVTSIITYPLTKIP